MGFLIRVLINAAAIYVATALVSGIRVSSPGALLLAALVLAVINAAVKPVMVILTLPLTILTLGVFLLVLNAVCLWLVTVAGAQPVVQIDVDAAMTGAPVTIVEFSDYQ